MKPFKKTLKQKLLFTSLALAPLLLIASGQAEVALPHFTLKNWGLENSASQIEKAWSISQGSKNVVVAVIDTGIDPNHPELKNCLWKAPTQAGRLTSGSVYGWDFVNKTANPVDTHGHGTHIAGIIAAAANPKEGTAGVAPNVQIMAVKYYSETAPGSVNLANTIKALHYAIDNGARIINYSGGGPEYSEEEYQAMKKAEQKGVLIVAAAGNDHRNTDEVDNRYYPAAYRQKGLTNIITVASISQENHLLPSSNWGAGSVDVAAPGEGILSTFPGGRHQKMTGTSQATAFVSGIAALLISKQPALTPSQVRDLILRNVDPVTALYRKVATGGKVNAYKALLALVPPAPVSKPLPSLKAKAAVVTTRKTASQF